MRQEREDLNELQMRTMEIFSQVKDCVRNLHVAADKLDEVWRDCKIVHASGCSAGILGGLLTIGGGVATIMTAGVATPLLITGLAVAAAGGTTNLATAIVNKSIESSKIKKAEKVLKVTLDCMNEVKNVIEGWFEIKEKVKLRYICLLAIEILERSNFLREIILELVLPFLGIPTELMIADNLIVQALLVGVKPAAKSGGKILGRMGTQTAGQTVAKGSSKIAESGAKASIKAGGKLAGGVIIGVGVAFLVLDVIDLGFTIRDIIENKGSDAANCLRQKADELEKVILVK